MKLFISQPMKNRDSKDIIEERKALTQYSKDKLCEIRLEVIDSYDANMDHTHEPLFYLGEMIKMMADADVVVFAKDWHHYNGCCIEHECAVRYGKIILYA